MDWTVHITTVPQTSLRMLFKIFQANIQLLTKREHLKTVENMIPGGLASVYDERHLKANTKYMENNDSALKSTYAPW